MLLYHVHFPEHSLPIVLRDVCTKFGGATVVARGVIGYWVDARGQLVEDEMAIVEVASDRPSLEVYAALANIGRAVGETCVYVKALPRDLVATIAYPSEPDGGNDDA